MCRIGIKQARAALPTLVRRVEAGEEIVITRRSTAAARLIGEPREPKALPTLREFRRSIAKGGIPAVPLIRKERNGS
jgi:prevent-host-death family protein